MPASETGVPTRVEVYDTTLRDGAQLETGLRAYLQKAVREAALRTSWLVPVPAFEEAQPMAKPTNTGRRSWRTRAR